MTTGQNDRRGSRWRASLVLALALVSACPAAEPEVIGADIPCTESQCSQHGACTVVELRPTCACDEGYEGVTCGTCADGFHRDVADACIPDAVCTEGACGDNGTCSVENGELVCTCDEGFSGPACTVCAAGFHAEDGVTGCAPDEVCLDNTCSGRGTCGDTTGFVVCTCDPGFSGSFCEVDDVALNCVDDNPCGDHGACNDDGPALLCLCDTGYAGSTCSDCYPGYAQNEAGDCVVQEACSPSTCSFAGECALDGALASCDCFVGYTGDFCQACADGFHRGGTDNGCVADTLCADNDPCSSGGTCTDDGGVAVCVCDAGYAGSLCEQCYPGYNDDDADGVCVLDEQCRAATCGLGGICDDAGGIVTCQCATGFEGDFCERNIDDCVNNACGTGTCIDLVGGNTCHCQNGTFGAFCP